MTLPAAVKLLDAPRPPGVMPDFTTQRGYWAGRKCQVKLCNGQCCGYVSCMFAALVELLEHAGYDVATPLKQVQTPPENFVLTLHRASGASLARGSSIAHSQQALRRLFPGEDVPVLFGALTDVELVEALIDGAAIRLHIAMGRLPKGPVKRWTGQGYSGGHAVTIRDIRIVDGQVETFWRDPMGKPAKGYRGEWRPLSEFDQAIRRNGRGLIPVTLTYRNAALAKPQPEPVPGPDPELARQLAEAKAALEASAATIAQLEATRSTLQRDRDALLEMRAADVVDAKAAQDAAARIVTRSPGGQP